MKEVLESVKIKPQDFNKMTKIPKWEKDQTFESYKQKILDWDRLTKIAPELKIHELLESLNEERKSEKKRLHHEIYNKDFDRSSTGVVGKCLDILEKWCTKSMLHQTAEKCK